MKLEKEPRSFETSRVLGQTNRRCLNKPKQNQTQNKTKKSKSKRLVCIFHTELEKELRNLGIAPGAFWKRTSFFVCVQTFLCCRTTVAAFHPQRESSY